MTKITNGVSSKAANILNAKLPYITIKNCPTGIIEKIDKMETTVMVSTNWPTMVLTLFLIHKCLPLVKVFTCEKICISISCPII